MKLSMSKKIISNQIPLNKHKKITSLRNSKLSNIYWLFCSVELELLPWYFFHVLFFICFCCFFIFCCMLLSFICISIVCHFTLSPEISKIQTFSLYLCSLIQTYCYTCISLISSFVVVSNCFSHFSQLLFLQLDISSLRAMLLSLDGCSEFPFNFCYNFILLKFLLQIYMIIKLPSISIKSLNFSSSLVTLFMHWFIFFFLYFHLSFICNWMNHR